MIHPLSPAAVIRPARKALVAMLLIPVILIGSWFADAGASARAQSSSLSSSALTAAGCMEAIDRRLSQQQELLRQVWFGWRKAADERLNSTRRDEKGVLWIKTGTDRWVSPAAAGAELRNADIDATTQFPGMNEITTTENRSSRTGIFAQKGMITSELIPGLLQSMRAFECRLAMVCESAALTFRRSEPGADGRLRVTTPGCDELATPPIAECRFGNADEQESLALQNIAAGFSEGIVHTHCDADYLRQLVDREASFLRIAVSYDAAERSLLQLGGNVDFFLRGLRGEFLAPLEQTLPLLSALSRLPCFPGQCNE